MSSSATPETFELGGGLTCARISLGTMDNNGYFLTDGQGPGLWIDAAADLDLIREVLGEQQVDTLVTTHHHHDHIGATTEFLEWTGAEALCGEPDREAIEQATGTSQRGLWDGDVVTVGEVQLEVIGLVGHTPGSITLAHRPTAGPAHLFTGDSLFPGGVGKTDSPEDFRSLLADVTSKIFDRFGDDTVVHPGHGAPTTLGVERPHLEEWAARGW